MGSNCDGGLGHNTPINRIFAGFCACAARGKKAVEPAMTLMKSRRRTHPSKVRVEDRANFASLSEMGGDVRFGSKADICAAKSHVRFTPESGHLQRKLECPLWAKSGHRQSRVTSRFPKFQAMDPFFPRIGIDCRLGCDRQYAIDQRIEPYQVSVC